MEKRERERSERKRWMLEHRIGYGVKRKGKKRHNRNRKRGSIKNLSVLSEGKRG